MSTKTFKYIAEGSLKPLGDYACHHCESTERPVYGFFGKIQDPALANTPELAEAEPGVSEVCAVCIRSGNIRKPDWRLNDIFREANGRQLADANREESVEEFHRTPDLSYTQNSVWPICCGDFCEYVGQAPAEGLGYSDYENWYPDDPFMKRYTLEDFYPLEKLPVMHTMALFHCLECAKKYYFFQYSGLMWPGPGA